MAVVRPATAADLPGLGRALAAAFDDDPFWTWLAPDRARYRRAAPAFFERDAALRLAAPGEVLVDDQLRGAAIWCAPAAWRSTVGDAARLAVPSFRLFGVHTLRGVTAVRALEGAHPPHPHHWFLSVLGTDPDHQGHGVGSALIRAVTDRCDEQGLPAYLESSKESNLAFYARHGFEVVRELTIPGGPSVWPMWREPR
jgi:GNAT superfamily N-acetyltransferase